MIQLFSYILNQEISYEEISNKGYSESLINFLKKLLTKT